MEETKRSERITRSVGKKTYTRALGARTRKRHFHKTENGKVVDFVIQLEVRVGGAWQPVIRYDYAHDFSHTFYPTFVSNPA